MSKNVVLYISWLRVGFGVDQLNLHGFPCLTFEDSEYPFYVVCCSAFDVALMCFNVDVRCGKKGHLWDWIDRIRTVQKRISQGVKHVLPTCKSTMHICSGV
jgi:hypothetical protein